VILVTVATGTSEPILAHFTAFGRAIRLHRFRWGGRPEQPNRYRCVFSTAGSIRRDPNVI
jgi:hypothetical protein